MDFSFERLNQWIQGSLTIKLVMMGLMTLLLFIISLLILDLIEDRNRTHEEAIQEVSNKWAREQQITGPMLVIPFWDFVRTESGQLIEEKNYAYFLPEDLSIEGQIAPEIRYRGIFDVIVYTTTLQFSGHFTPPDFSGWSVSEDYILWEEAFLAVTITDMRGINEAITLRWQEEHLLFDAGIESGDQGGVSTRVPLNINTANRYSYQFDMHLNGSSALNFSPLGKQTTVQLSSVWNTPSFGGSFLPDERAITEDGFTATWRVLHLNRPYPQQWRGEREDLYALSFGVTLLRGVDHYQKSLRATKYAILVIALTFLAFFLIEVRSAHRVHPFQYLLVGFALCLFYTLLVSLSEHIPFDYAYLISSTVTVAVVTGYVGTIFHSRVVSTITASFLLLLYAFVFLILQLEDYALLAGSIGLLLALILTMYLTRSIHWFGEPAAEESAP